MIVNELYMYPKLTNYNISLILDTYISVEQIIIFFQTLQLCTDYYLEL